MTDVLFAQLFDDASTFPPGNMPMEAAVAAHLVHRDAWYGQMVGPFVCAAPRLNELAHAVEVSGTGELAVSLTVPGGPSAVGDVLAEVGRQPGLVLRALEYPAAPEDIDGRASAPNESYVELPPASVTDEHLRALSARALRLKIRTGGPTSDAFPREEQLARALVMCTQSGVPFKCTAGLHNAVRHLDPATSFEHHGFLNVLLATHRAITTASVDQTRRALAEQDGWELADAIRELDEGSALQVRRAFLSFGTCSIAEPLQDLTSLGLVKQP